MNICQCNTVICYSPLVGDDLGPFANNAKESTTMAVSSSCGRVFVFLVISFVIVLSYGLCNCANYEHIILLCLQEEHKVE